VKNLHFLFKIIITYLSFPYSYFKVEKTLIIALNILCFYEKSMEK
jgi:hypothetical protein